MKSAVHLLAREGGVRQTHPDAKVAPFGPGIGHENGGPGKFGADPDVRLDGFERVFQRFAGRAEEVVGAVLDPVIFNRYVWESIE